MCTRTTSYIVRTRLRAKLEATRESMTAMTMRRLAKMILPRCLSPCMQLGVSELRIRDLEKEKEKENIMLRAKLEATR